MSSKKKKSEGRSGDSVEQAAEIFQAVILSDSFNFRFLPITLETPRVLLPLVNVPLLDYTIEFLVEAGVQEIFVFCSAHADQVKKHISQSKWTGGRSPCDVKTIVVEDCFSSLLKSDFVLVSGDVVSNMKLEQVFQEHKERRNIDRSSLMTMVFKVANPGHRASLFNGNESLQIRYDLLDCNICICSTTVPQLFTDNFDYQTRDDFVKGILVNEEDILSRWAYPITPDNSVFFMEFSYSFTRHNVYLDTELSLARDCILEENVLISKGTSVGAGTVITNSVIGRNCVIGDSVQLDGVHLWDNVTVEDGCKISEAILCKNVHIKRNVTISSGSLISFNVVVGPDLVLQPGVKITRKKQRKENDSDFGMEQPLQERSAPYEDDGMERISSSEDDVSSVSSNQDSAPESPPPEDSRLFYTEVLESIRNGVANNVVPENIILEINASKLAYDETCQELNQAVVKSLLESCLNDPSLSKQDHSKNLKKTTEDLLPVISKYIKTADGQRDALNATEEFFLQTMWAAPLFQVFLHMLYDKEVLEESVILHWYLHRRGDISCFEPQRKKLREQISRFITWLQEAEEESDEEDDDNDDDADDEGAARK
ncbi:Translation initiation factor eIF-2B subunit epsilon [Acropora cervicornis]|uniref:Translation initiation factor eIF2B subunit epsilon n=1 Tax=Acropora cervicornis TaxID=6130 RepID=A0AAD9QDH6_ACRCE|nr:Translation initiation factor eIF-2B subunit epsilon [Acropora cervicornis]